MNARLGAWIALVGGLSILAYASRAAEGKPPSDLLYRYDTAASSLFGYAVILGLVLVISFDRFDLLALRAPRSWGRALALAAATLAIVLVGGTWLDHLVHAGREQGYTPTHWEPARLGQYAANFVVVAAVAPVVEELLFRGLGYSLLVRFGRWPAILVVGLAFGLVHGLVAGLVVLALFGCVLAWLRMRTDSVYPGIVVHATFNAVALVLAVAT